MNRILLIIAHIDSIRISKPKQQNEINKNGVSIGMRLRPKSSSCPMYITNVFRICQISSVLDSLTISILFPLSTSSHITFPSIFSWRFIFYVLKCANRKKEIHNEHTNVYIIKKRELENLRGGWCWIRFIFYRICIGIVSKNTTQQLPVAWKNIYIYVLRFIYSYI